MTLHSSPPDLALNSTRPTILLHDKHTVDLNHLEISWLSRILIIPSAFDQ